MAEYIGPRDGGKTSEIGANRWMSKLFSPGVMTGWTASQRGAGANMSVDVALGDGSIWRVGTDTYGYYGFSDATKNVVVSASDPTNPRKDILVAYIDKAVVSSASNDNPNALKFSVVAGTAAGSPADPSDSTIQSAVGAANPFIKLARIAVAASASSIVTANLTDIRSFAALVSWGGWQFVNATLTYSSASSPTYVVSTSVDLTGYIAVGAKVTFTNNNTTFYGFVTAITSGTMTLYGGTDYTVANSAITSVYFSNALAPIGFTLNPNKWTVEITDASSRSQATPTLNTWYNPGSITITLPPGLWNLEYNALVYLNYGSAPGGAVDQYSTLSTANNTESDNDFTGGIITTTQQAAAQVTRRKIISVSVATAYFLNTKTSASGSTGSINIRGDLSKTIIRAICAYL